MLQDENGRFPVFRVLKKNREIWESRSVGEFEKRPKSVITGSSDRFGPFKWEHLGRGEYFGYHSR
jgi:hypothetical protein